MQTIHSAPSRACEPEQAANAEDWRDVVARNRRYPYRSERRLAWRNLMVSGLNALIEAGDLELRKGGFPGKHDCPEPIAFDLKNHEALAHVTVVGGSRDFPSIGIVLDPLKGAADLMKRFYGEDRAWLRRYLGTAYAWGHFGRERRCLSTPQKLGFSADKLTQMYFSLIDVKPNGYKDRSDWFSN